VLDSEIVKGTTDLHHSIADMIGTEPNVFFKNTTALDGADNVLNAHTTTRYRTIFGLLLIGKRSALGLLVRHGDSHIRKREAKETEILQQLAAVGKWVWRQIDQRLLVQGTLDRVREKTDPCIPIS